MKDFKELYENERRNGGRNISQEMLPEALKEILVSNIPLKGNVLLPDGEHIVAYLDEILQRFPNTTFYVYFIQDSFYQNAKAIKNYSNLVVGRNSDKPLITKINFEFIFTMPPFGKRGNYREMGYSSNDFSISQIEELVTQLTNNGKLIAITTQGITFNAQANKFRTNIVNKYKLVKVDSLPQRLFRTIAIKSTLIEIVNGKTDNVFLNEYELKNNKLTLKTSITKSANELLKEDSWDISKFLILEDETIQQYESSSCKKYLLAELANDIFRGRSDLPYVEDAKGTFVVNIADIQDSIINFENLRVIPNDRNNKRYELENGDILLTSRGTDIRTAIFNKPNDEMYIASAGIIVIRLKDKNLSKYLQIFFESEIGTKLLDSLKGGTVVANIIPAKVRELRIPILSEKKMVDLISRYNQAVTELNNVKERAKQMVEIEKRNLENYFISFTLELIK